jgi:hypothetical protein
MKPLVIQFQEDLTLGSKRITELCRTAKLISVKLEKGSIQDWIEHELNGYPSDLAELPKYRILSGGQLQFLNPGHGWRPVLGSPPMKADVRQSIAELEAFKPGSKGMFFTLRKKFTLCDASGSTDHIVSGCPQRIKFSITRAVGILEAVRNRLLDWSIELEKQGILG